MTKSAKRLAVHVKRIDSVLGGCGLRHPRLRCRDASDDADRIPV